MRKHRGGAEIVAARRANQMMERGDRDEQLVWLRIRRAIVELQAVPAGKPNLGGELPRSPVEQPEDQGQDHTDDEARHTNHGHNSPITTSIEHNKMRRNLRRTFCDTRCIYKNI
jgi:hypothetical protein